MARPLSGIQMSRAPWQAKLGGFISDLDAVPPALLRDKLPMRMSAISGDFNRSTQHLLILPDEEYAYGGARTDMVHAEAEG